MVELDDLRLLVAIADAKAVSAAARARKISKQRASERLGEIERALGVRLFERTTRVVRATEAGSRFLVRARRLLEEADEAVAELQAEEPEPRGLLRVAATLAFGHAEVVDLIAAFLERYPGVRVELILADRRFDLVGEGIDVAFLVGEVLDPDQVARRLGPVAAHAVASPAYLDLHGEPRTVEEWRRARTIGRFPGDTWTAEGGAAVRVEPTLLVNSPQAALQAALRGVGVAWLPDLLAAPHIAAGDLVVVADGRRLRETSIYAVLPSRRHVPAKVRRIVDLAAETLFGGSPVPSVR